MLTELNSFDFKEQFMSVDFKTNKGIRQYSKTTRERTHIEREKTFWIDDKGNRREKRCYHYSLIGEKSYYTCHILLGICLCIYLCIFLDFFIM